MTSEKDWNILGKKIFLENVVGGTDIYSVELINITIQQAF